MPADDQRVLLGLGRTNRIVRFSEELPYVTIEPGVTRAYMIFWRSAARACGWIQPAPVRRAA